MSTNSDKNEQTDLETILERIAPERKAEFLRLRLRLKRFDENDELLAVASYLDTLVVLVDGITKSLVPGNSNGMDALMRAVVEEEAKTRQLIVDNDTKLWQRVEEEQQRTKVTGRSIPWPPKKWWELHTRREWIVLSITAVLGLAIAFGAYQLGFLLGQNRVGQLPAQTLRSEVLVRPLDASHFH
jgi:hypothetical protein